MRLFKHLRDPVYVHRPTQILTRVWRLIRGCRERETTTLPWGGQLTVFGREANGRAILHRGLTELTVTEACFRLSRPGTVAVDVGANVGQMTSALAHGMKKGRLHAFEPHPAIYPVLEENGRQIAREVEGVSLDVHNVAVGRASGTETLHVPDAWSENYGLATMQDTSDAEAVQVDVCRLVDVLNGPIQLLKIDVEGHEAAVLDGARGLLTGHKINHVLFEEHSFGNSAVVERLENAGYEIFSVERTLRGPKLKNPCSTDGYNFIATSAVDECARRFEPNGYMSMKRSEI